MKRKHCGDKTCYYGVHGKAELFSGSNFCPTCGKPAEVVEVTYKVDDFDDSISDVEERFHHLFRLVFLSKDEFCIIPSIYNCRELGMYADFLHVGETVIDVEASKKRDDVARLIDELKARNLEHTVSFVAVK